MKLNKSNKHKGKVHPSPSSSSSSSLNSNDAVSKLNKLLPPTILTLISILSLQDKQVLAYMLSHSLKPPHGKSKRLTVHNSTPSFDCGCFECYTCYWFLWDSSPHRELIHQAIEAFEEHLSTSELPPTPNPNPSRRKGNKLEQAPPLFTEVNTEEVVVVKREEVHEMIMEVKEGGGAHENENINNNINNIKKKKMVQQQQQQQNKGLARKVLPDVIGLFHSRLWSLWGPNV
ncbi:hypothetical protein vseg_020107 [Gypsophila vaccaria]